MDDIHWICLVGRCITELFGRWFFSRVRATLQVAMSVCRLVGWSVGRSVGLSHFAFFGFLGFSRVGKHIFECLVSYK